MAEIRQDVLIRSQVLMTEKNPVIAHLEKRDYPETPERDSASSVKENPNQTKNFRSTLNEISPPKKDTSYSKSKIQPLPNPWVTSAEDPAKEEKMTLELLLAQELTTTFKVSEALLKEGNAIKAQDLSENFETKVTSNTTKIETAVVKPESSTQVMQKNDATINEESAQEIGTEQEVKLENFSKALNNKVPEEDNQDNLQDQTLDIKAPIAIEIKPFRQPINQKASAATSQEEIGISSGFNTKSQQSKNTSQTDQTLLQESGDEKIQHPVISSSISTATKDSLPLETHTQTQQNQPVLFKNSELLKKEENLQHTLQSIKATAPQQVSPTEIQVLNTIEAPPVLQEIKQTSLVSSTQQNSDESEEIIEIEGKELTHIEKPSSRSKSFSVGETEYFEPESQQNDPDIESFKINQPEGFLSNKTQNVESKSFDLSAVDQQKLIDHIAEKFEKNVQAKNNSFEIQLNPEGLGQIHIELSFEEKSVKATFKSSETEALQFLQQHSGRIQEIFASHGFSSEQNSLSFSLQDSPQRGSQQGYQSDNQSYSGAAKDYETQLTPAYQARKAGYFNQNGTFAISV